LIRVNSAKCSQLLHPKSHFKKNNIPLRGAVFSIFGCKKQIAGKKANIIELVFPTLPPFIFTFKND
jgi:hypothetical protein